MSEHWQRCDGVESVEIYVPESKRKREVCKKTSVSA